MSCVKKQKPEIIGFVAVGAVNVGAGSNHPRPGAQTDNRRGTGRGIGRLITEEELEEFAILVAR